MNIFTDKNPKCRKINMKNQLFIVIIILKTNKQIKTQILSQQAALFMTCPAVLKWQLPAYLLSAIQGCLCFKHNVLNICLKHSFKRMFKRSMFKTYYVLNIV